MFDDVQCIHKSRCFIPCNDCASKGLRLLLND